MNVTQLIEALKTMPKDAEVYHLWDGEARSIIEHVWLARNGHVITADVREVCYSSETRPAHAPTSKQQPHWHSPDEPQYKPIKTN